MLRNTLLVTLRHFARNINHTVINILGLSVGIASCIVVFVIVRGELAFDKFHSKYDNIYRVVHTTTNSSGNEPSAVTPYPFINGFRQDFSDVPLATSFHYSDEVQMAFGAEKITVEHVLFADSLFFRVFDFEVLEGDPNADLGQPGKVFLSESMARKVLKPGAPRTINLRNILELEVAGIIKDPPASSHLPFDLIVSMPSLNKDFLGFPLDIWTMEMSGYTYLSLPKQINPTSIESRLGEMIKKYYPDLDTQHREYFLQPLADIHFNETYHRSYANIGGMSKSSLYILGLLGAFLLAIACVNFINLSTALASKKSREIGVRKALGASRRQLSRQFLAEAFVITLVSLIIALGEVEIFTSIIGELLGKPLVFTLSDTLLWPFLVLLVVMTAILAGAYPAWVLSRFQPAVVLKSNLSGVGTGQAARKYLVVFQFLVAQVLIIGTLVISDQMEYFHSKPLGFASKGIINVGLPTNKESDRTAFLSRLQGIKEIESVSFSLGSPTSDNNFSTNYYLAEKGGDDMFETQLKIVDSEYARTYGLELAGGRWFTETEERIAADTTVEKGKRYTYVVNEALAKSLGFANPNDILGKNIVTGLNDIDAEVVGIMKDFHTESLHENIKPATMVIFPYFYYDAGIRFNGDVTQLMKEVGRAYSAAYPDHVFNYTFLDEHLAMQYQEEQRAFSLIKAFAGLAIFISSLGLLGLVSFITLQKVKEVGVRKVFGASVTSIVLLFSTGFARLIAIAFLVAAPLSWYLMNQWLQEFPYRTTVQWEVFVIAIALTTAVAMLTVLYQSVRAALANPAKSLRAE